MKTPFSTDDFLLAEDYIDLFRIPCLEDHLKASFEELDTNKNGYIDGKELNFLAFKHGKEIYKVRFKHVCGQFGALLPDFHLTDENNEKLAEKLGQEILKEFDKDLNGKIDLEEYQKIMLRKSKIIGFKWVNSSKEEIKRVLKEYIQFIKEFSQEVTLEMVIADKKKEEEERAKNKKKRSPSYSSSPFGLYQFIIDQWSSFAQPSKKNYKEFFEEKGVMQNNPEKYFDKIKEYVTFLERFYKSFESIL